MKTLKCLIEVPDKHTREMYKVGEVYEFNDERAKEVLAARTSVTREPYFEEYAEVTEEVITEIIEEEKPKKKTRKRKVDK